MAASAADIVTVAALKRALEIPAEIDEHDVLLGEEIERAIAWVSRLTSAPLIRTVETVRCLPLNGSEAPLILRHTFLSEVLQVRYWTAAGDLRGEPDGTIAAADLGRFDTAEYGVGCLWPPADGWPVRLAGSVYHVEVAREVDPVPLDVQRAIIIAARLLYDGMTELRPTSALLNLVAGFQHEAV